ncbi:MAG: hypothetical protein AB8F95_14805 [Bacteroidia bacterium]
MDTYQIIALIALVVAIIALVVAIIALVRTFGSGKGAKKRGLAIPNPFANPHAHLPPRLSYFEVKDNTHAIRDHKLVNHLSLHFRNTGGNLFYENIHFTRSNKHLEVEILAEQELEIFHDPRDDQKVQTGECLRVTFEREIGEKMEYDFQILFANDSGTIFSQRIYGKKGLVPEVEEPAIMA